MKWLKLIFNIVNIKDALTKVYNALSLVVNTLKQLNGNEVTIGKTKTIIDIGKVIELCITIMGIIAKILAVLGSPITTEVTKLPLKAKNIDIETAINELNKIKL